MSSFGKAESLKETWNSGSKIYTGRLALLPKRVGGEEENKF